jgi:hypothetical protein
MIARILFLWQNVYKLKCQLIGFTFHFRFSLLFQSQWPRVRRRRSAAERLLGSWVRIPPGAWIFVSCERLCWSGRGLCDGPIPRPEESYRPWCVSECDQVKINNLDTYYEQVGRRRKDCETKRITFLLFSWCLPLSLSNAI